MFLHAGWQLTRHFFILPTTMGEVMHLHYCATLKATGAGYLVFCSRVLLLQAAPDWLLSMWCCFTRTAHQSPVGYFCSLPRIFLQHLPQTVKALNFTSPV